VSTAGVVVDSMCVLLTLPLLSVSTEVSDFWVQARLVTRMSIAPRMSTFFMMTSPWSRLLSKNVAQLAREEVISRAMKRITLLLVVALFATSLAAAPNPVTTVILVRHAERASQEDDSPLSAAGVERAKELARVLAGVKIDAVYATQFQRTKNTAAPIAEALGLPVGIRNTGPTYAADLAMHIRSAHAGQTVLVVGHSNSTPEVMRALGATDVPAIPETQYDNLFVLTDAAGAAPKVVALRFGAVLR